MSKKTQLRDYATTRLILVAFMIVGQAIPYQKLQPRSGFYGQLTTIALACQVLSSEGRNERGTFCRSIHCRTNSTKTPRVSFCTSSSISCAHLHPTLSKRYLQSPIYSLRAPPSPTLPRRSSPLPHHLHPTDTYPISQPT